MMLEERYLIWRFKHASAEQWIKEGRYALNWTRLSCHDSADNQVRLQWLELNRAWWYHETHSVQENHL